jgi:hypothetical protein
MGYGWPYELSAYRLGDAANMTMVEDPLIRDYYEKIQAVLYKDTDEMNRLLKEVGPYILDQALAIWMPAKDVYTVWQPWLQNYKGECWGGVARPDEWAQYVWLDMKLKESLGY